MLLLKKIYTYLIRKKTRVKNKTSSLLVGKKTKVKVKRCACGGDGNYYRLPLFSPIFSPNQGAGIW